MLHRVKEVNHLGKYAVQLKFQNGDVKVVDFEEQLKTAKNMFLPPKDIDYFKQVACDGSTIVWSNGLGMCPDRLYEMGK